MLTSFQKFQTKETTFQVSEQSDTKKLEVLVSKFYEELVKINSLSAIKYTVDPTEVKNQIEQVIMKEKEIANKRSEEIYNNFTEGTYDTEAFSNIPKVTPELKVITAKHNREFIQRLFTKCKFPETFEFWIKHNNVILPKDSLALGVALGCNIVTLQFLKNEGFFENLSKEEKINIVARAQRFGGEGLNFLEAEFSIDSSKINLSFTK